MSLIEPELLGWLAAGLIGLTSLALLTSQDWRWTLTALALQTLGVFVLVSFNWPLSLAAVKLVAGWMAAAVLGVTLAGDAGGARRALRPRKLTSLSGQIFRLLAAAVIALTVASVAPALADWAPGVTLAQSYAILGLMGFGALLLGLTAQPLYAVIGLLTILSGFEILYAVSESSTLVAGMLAGVNLGLALVGAYLLTLGVVEAEA